MKFHALLPVRDEADIISQCLEQALTWADAICVFDTGSVDNTWEIVQDFASRDKRIMPIRKEPVYFSETRLRSYMFHVARQNMHNGDWFLRGYLDSGKKLGGKKSEQSKIFINSQTWAVIAGAADDLRSWRQP